MCIRQAERVSTIENGEACGTWELTFLTIAAVASLAAVGECELHETRM